MSAENRHEAWLRFLRRIIDVPLGYSRDDLMAFRQIALNDNPSVVPLIDEYLRFAERSETNVISRRAGARKHTSKQMHLFDLLRDKTLFPQNADLSRFAAEVVPGMQARRHDKMSRSDIAARIIDFIEGSDAATRGMLEETMYNDLVAMKKGRAEKEERGSFFSKWEKIIKGIEI